ncbi:MAG: DUF4340 domain-containing protein, partial [Candidatus Rokuibacteriota bacterium]
MRWKTTAVLAVLFVGLAAFFYVYEVRQGPAREKATAEKDRLWKDLDAKDIEEIVITRGADVLHLKKAGDGWTLAAPVAAKAETRPVDDLLLSLATLRVEREIEASPANAADFGLAPPAAEIAFKAKGQERKIRLGGKNPTGIWVYAQEGAKPAVILVPDSLLRDAQKSAADFRDRSVLAFERKDVKAFEVQPARGGPSLKAERKGTDDWQMTVPITAPAEREQVSALLEQLKSAKIKEFVADLPKIPGAYGLDQPLKLVLWLGEEKERVAKTLRFGSPVPDKKAIYAQREGDSTIFLVDEALAKAIPTTATALRAKTVFAYDRDKLERLELESSKGKVALALEGGAWRITAPAPLKADERAMGDVLQKARDLRATEFVADDAKRLAQFGLDRPHVKLTVWEKDAKEPKALLLAPVKDKALAYATVIGGDPAGAFVVTVEGTILEALSRSAQDFRDRSLFATFNVQDVTRVQIQHETLRLVLERKGEEDWHLVAPRRGKARGTEVSDLLWGLRNLKWRDVVAEAGWEPARYGLEPASTTITLSDKTGRVVA